MKVLHIHDSSLNDPRIINAAVTGAKAGYEPHFCGTMTDDHMHDPVFKSYSFVDFPSRAKVSRRLTGTFLDNYWLLYPWPNHAIRMERRFSKVIDDIKPDIIHAHNIFAAYHCRTLGVPMVLDDHELFSMQVKISNTGSGLKEMERVRRWEEKERILAEKYPIITVSKPIAEYYQQFTSNVGVVPNYPLKDQINPNCELVPSTGREFTSIYLGADRMDRPNPMRDIRGLHDVFNDNGVGKLVRIGVKTPDNQFIESLGNLTMRFAYQLMRERGHIGLLPWLPHWFHKYCSPNKVAEYAHCGLLLMTTNDFDFVISELQGRCETFVSYRELTEKLEYYNNDREELDKKRHASLHFAKSHLSWENNEHLILEAYKKA